MSNTQSTEDRDLEALATNVIHQAGDLLYDNLPKDVAHEHFVTARQATNDRLIDFTKGLILKHISDSYLLKSTVEKVLTNIVHLDRAEDMVGYAMDTLKYLGLNIKEDK